MHRLRPLVLLLTVLVLLLVTTGCSWHRHRVGLGPTQMQVVEESRQFYLFFGLVRLNSVDTERMASGLTSYEIQTEYGLTDVLITPLLLPLSMSSRTVTVLR